MTALVTGGLGFIGSELVKHLLVAGEARPVVFDVGSGPGRLADVAGSVELVQGDVKQTEIRLRGHERRQRAVAEELFDPGPFEDRMGAAELERHAGDPAAHSTDDVFRPEQGRQAFGCRALAVDKPGGIVGHQTGCFDIDRHRRHLA